MAKKKKLTTTGGIPVGDNQNSLTAGPRGPLPVQDWQLFEKHAHFNRERIPERVVHAKGSGAYGTLTVTHDITRYTKAGMFSSVGKKTDCFLRFSTVAGERGAADAERDVRGFAMKFYTEAIIARDRESHQRDLFEAIERGDFPGWNVKVQVMTEQQAEKNLVQSVRSDQGMAAR